MRIYYHSQLMKLDGGIRHGEVVSLAADQVNKVEISLRIVDEAHAATTHVEDSREVHDHGTNLSSERSRTSPRGFMCVQYCSAHAWVTPKKSSIF